MAGSPGRFSFAHLYNLFQLQLGRLSPWSGLQSDDGASTGRHNEGTAPCSELGDNEGTAPCSEPGERFIGFGVEEKKHFQTDQMPKTVPELMLWKKRQAAGLRPQL